MNIRSESDCGGAINPGKASSPPESAAVGPVKDAKTLALLRASCGARYRRFYYCASHWRLYQAAAA